VIEAADVLDDPKLLAQGISAGDIAGLIRAIRTGLAYVNIHTVLSPAGEIRGDVAHHEHEN
jgi:CHRD domain